VTTQPVAPVIPSPARPGARRRAGTGVVRRLPLAAAPEIPAAAHAVLYGFGRIDASGRVADRTITSALGWHAGDGLTLTAAASVTVPALAAAVRAVIGPARPGLRTARHHGALWPGGGADPGWAAAEAPQKTCHLLASASWSAAGAPRRRHFM
jgi:hypothetical protein